MAPAGGHVLVGAQQDDGARARVIALRGDAVGGQYEHPQGRDAVGAGDQCPAAGFGIGAIEEQGTYLDRGEREARDAGWKDYWRSNPDANPRMAEAFKE